jgi:hypothetical protein
VTDRFRDLRLGALVALLLLGVNVLHVSANLGFLHKAKQVKETDQWRYIQMSRDPERRNPLTREGTYAWRVFVPTAVRGLEHLGLSENLSFWLVTNVFLFGFLLTTWVYLGDLGFALPLRLSGLALLSLTQGVVRWYEYQYWMTDAPCLFLIALALLLIRREHRRLLHPVSILAAFVRESYVVVYPYLFLRLLRRGAGLWAALRTTVSVAIVPTLVLVGLRVAIIPDRPDSLVADIRDNLALRLRHGSEQPYLLTIGSLGVFFPLLLLFPRWLLGQARRHPEAFFYVAFFYLLCLPANNTERELGYTLPVVLPAALLSLGRFAEKTRLPLPPLLAAAVALQVLFFAEQRYLPMGSSMHQPPNPAVVTAMVGAWLLAQWLLVRGRRREAPVPEPGSAGPPG